MHYGFGTMEWDRRKAYKSPLEWDRRKAYKSVSPPGSASGVTAIIERREHGVTKERRRARTIAELPIDIFQEIFSFGEQEDLQVASLVGKKWCRSIKSNLCLNCLRLLRKGYCCIKPVNSHSQYYSTINEAVDAAKEGDEIWIGEGTYTESLQITKSITLRGYGTNNVLIDVPSTSFLEVRDAAPKFINLCLGSDNGREFSCILVNGGSPSFVACNMQMLYLLAGDGTTVNKCNIQHLSIQNEGTCVISNNIFPGSRFASVCITGANTYPTLIGNLIKEGELMGILLESCKGALLENNVIQDVKQCGLEAVDVNRLVMRGNVIKGCGSYGIYVRSQSFANIQGNTISLCKSAAICFDHSFACVMDNTIKDVISSAIHAYYCSRGIICDNLIERTGHSSVILDGCRGMEFTGNKVITNDALAVLIIKGHDVVVKGNEIHSGGSNIVIENSSPLVLYNTIRNGSIGILVYGNSRPVISSNDVTNHEDAGIDILVGSSPVLLKNNIHHNGGSGVAISEVINFVDRCEFPNKSREALVSIGLPLLISNSIRNNTLMGINSKGFLYAEIGNELENNEHFVPPQIAQCIESLKCTYTETKDDYVPQYWHPSVDDRNVGICQTCYQLGHFEVMGQVRRFLKNPVLSRFYCDCDCSQRCNGNHSRSESSCCDFSSSPPEAVESSFISSINSLNTSIDSTELNLMG